MAWIERSGKTGWRTAWEPPTASGLGKKLSLSWPTHGLAVRAQEYVDENHNAVSKEDVYKYITDEELPPAAPKKSGVTFRQYAEQWLTERKIADGTRNAYRSQLETAWFPAFGGKLIAEVDDSDIQSVITKLREKGLKNQSVCRYWAVLTAIFNRAMKVKALGLQSNPTKYVDFDRNQTDYDGQAPDHDDLWLKVWEYRLILEKIHPDSRAFIQLLAENGLRISEAAALQACDFQPATDGEPPLLTVRRTWSSDMKTGRRSLSVPKGKTSRTLVLTNHLAQQLQALVDGRPDSAFIFQTVNGRPISPSNFHTRRWRPALLAAMACPDHPPTDPTKGSSCNCPGVLRRWMKIHSLRHSYTTWMIEAGRKREDVADDLGHADLQMIQKVYHHIARRKDTSRAELMDGIMGRDTRKGDNGEEGLPIAV